MRFDFVVVGGGLCGTLAAQHLARSGRTVCLLEAGPITRNPLPDDVRGFQRATAPLASVDAKQWPFRGPRGYQWHRVRALGGRTLLWGGWMQRPSADYFAARRSMDAAWPWSLRELEPWLSLAERRLNVRIARRGALHARLTRLGFDAMPKHEAVLPGAPRMLTARDLTVPRTQRGQVVSLAATSRGISLSLAEGREVEARRVVLAASPIETARILGRATELRFADHLIAGAMVITARQPVARHPRGGADPAVAIAPAQRASHRFTTEVRGPTPLEELGADDLSALGFTAEQAKTRSFFVVFALGETDPHRLRTVRLETRARTPRFVERAHTAWETGLAGAMNAQCLSLAGELGGKGSEPFLFYDALDFGSGGHETGTCLDALDLDGRWKGCPDVFVADGAGVPGATDGHPSLTLAANALRVAAAAGTVG